MIKSVINTSLDGVLIVQNEVFSDKRGTFLQNYQEEDFFHYKGLDCKFVQDNISESGYNVIRGLHYQLKNPQIKLVTVLYGGILDVVVDVRINSPTFGKWFSVELDAFDGKSLLVPPGFAHGFRAVYDDNIVLYKTSNSYNKEDEYSINWNDPDIKIDWKNDFIDPIISDKDTIAPYLRDVHIKNLPTYEYL